MNFLFRFTKYEPKKREVRVKLKKLDEDVDVV